MNTVLTALKRYIGEDDSQETIRKELETTLMDAVQRTIKDSTFRIQLGCSPDFWRLTCLVIVELARDPEAQSCLVALLKLQRNAAAFEQVNQQLAIEHGALREIEKILQEKLKTHDQDSVAVLQAGTQAICNMMTGNQISLDIIWKEWMRDVDRGYIYSNLLSFNDDTVVMSAMVLILNCIRKSPERCRLLAKSKVGRAMLAALLDDLERLHDNQESKNFELGYAIVSEMIDGGQLVNMLRIMETPDKEPGHVNERMTGLVKLLDSKIHNYKSGFPTFLGTKELKKLAGMQAQLCKQAVKLMQDAKNDPDLKLSVDDVSQIYTNLVLILQINATLLTISDDGHTEFKNLLLADNALELTTELLRSCETMDNKKFAFNYLKRDSVRLLGALCYKDRQVQDKLRDIGAIQLVLAQCKIDDANPYIREYAVLALRNILENNTENQELIAEMKPLEAVQTDELAEMGLRPRLVDGKVKLERDFRSP